MNTYHSPEFKSYAVNEIIAKYTTSRIREKSGDEIEVEVPLKIGKSKGALWILVILPQNYPSIKPIIQIINAKVQHEYIDDNYRVIHPILDEWNSNSSLIEVIETIHVSFDSNPPQLKKGTNAAKADALNKPQNLESLSLRKPNLADLDDRIKNMSSDEINTILNDETFFVDFFMELDGARDFYDDFVKI